MIESVEHEWRNDHDTKNHCPAAGAFAGFEPHRLRQSGADHGHHRKNRADRPADYRGPERYRRGHRVCRSARFQSAGTCRRSFRRTGAGIRSGNRSRRTGRSRCRDARHRRRRRLYHEGRRRAVSAYLRTPALQLHHEEGSRKARLVRRVSRAVCPRQMHRRQPFRKL